MQIAHFYEFGSITYEEQLMLLRFCRCGLCHNCVPPTLCPLPPLETIPFRYILASYSPLPPCRLLYTSYLQQRISSASVFPWGRIEENSLTSKIRLFCGKFSLYLNMKYENEGKTCIEGIFLIKSLIF